MYRRVRPALLNKKGEDLKVKKVQIMITAVVSTLMSWLGILAIPVFLLVGCNVIDYITGLLAAPYRTEPVSSYKGIRGIVKKVCMWLLVIVGAWLDSLINYAAECAGLPISLPFIVAIVVAVWLTLNEIISILENIIDIGVPLPPFLLPIVKHIKQAVEDKASIADKEPENGEPEERDGGSHDD